MEKKRVIPLDGPGPFGYPGCYFLTRYSKSTKRYNEFVKNLRKAEAEIEINIIDNQIKHKQLVNSKFNNKHNRRRNIRTVAALVENGMKALENDLKEKKNRLKEKLERELIENLKLVVLKRQDTEYVTTSRQEKLKELKEKRHNESAAKYKEPPLSKCPHVTAEIFAIHNKQSKDINKIQMQEKQSRKMQEIELEKLWLESGKKYDKTLALRAEYNAIDRSQRDSDCFEYNKFLSHSKLEKEKFEKDLENKNQAEYMKKEKEKMLEEDKAKLKADHEKRDRNLKEMQKAYHEGKVLADSVKQESTLISKTFLDLNDLANKGANDAADLRKRKCTEFDYCNREMVTYKNQDIENRNEISRNMLVKISKQNLQTQEERRCMLAQKSIEIVSAARQYQIEQIGMSKILEEDRKKEKDSEREELIKRTREFELENEKREKEKKKSLKEHQKYVLQQIEDKRKAREIEMEAERACLEKYRQANKKYDELLKHMLKRDSFSDHVHHFKNIIKSNYKTSSSNRYCK